jgi:hypothetical protein
MRNRLQKERIYKRTQSKDDVIIIIGREAPLKIIPFSGKYG